MTQLAYVAAQDVACARGGRELYRNLNFKVGAGQVLALEGPNGAGKTSTLRMIAGLLPQVEGAITFEEDNKTISDAEERAHLVGWLGHTEGVKAQLSVKENALFFAQIFAAADNVADILGRVGLGGVSDLPAAFLSAGQRRRLALARLLLSDRPLWLLDEPMAALDDTGRALAAQLVGNHCGRGGIAIVASHEPLVLASSHVTIGRA